MNNPDPSKYTPVKVVGIDALQKRFQQQEKNAQAHREHIQTLRDVLEAVDESNTQLNLRFTALTMKQTQIFERLLVVLRKIEVLRLRGLPLQDAEVKYRARLYEMLRALKSPYGRIQTLSDSLVGHHLTK